MRARLLFVVSLFVCLPALAGPYDLDVTTARLDNGFTILVSRDRTVSDVAVEIWIRAGSADDGPGRHGLAHLFEHMLPGATRVLANPENRAAFDRDRLDSNGATGAEYTRFVMRVPASSIELPIAAYADRISAAPESITAADLAKHQQTVLAEFRNGAGRTWDAHVTNPVRRALFGAEHPYGHAGLGSTLDVEATTLEDARRWFRRYFGAANTMLVVVGNVDPVQVVELARKHFGPIAAGETNTSAVPPVSPLTERRVVHVVAADAKPALDFYWRTPRWSDPARQDVAMAKELLKAALSCDAIDLEELEAQGGGSTGLRLRCEGMTEERALAALDRFLASTPSIDAARETRLAAFGDILNRLGWRPSRAQLLAEGLWFAGDPRAYLRHIERVQSVTAEQVMASAREWLRNPLIVRIAPSNVTAAVDRGAALSIPAPSVAAPSDVRDAMEDGVRVINVRRASPVVIVHLVPRGGAVVSRTVTPSMFDVTLRELLKDAKRGAFDLVVVGDVDRARIVAPLRALGTATVAATPDPPAFTPVPGASQTRLTAILFYPPEMNAARVALAADLLRTRLNDRLREKERWVYSADARFERRNGAPAIVIDVPIRDDLAAQAIPVIQSYIDALNEQLSAADASRARGAELRRIGALASAPHDLAAGLVNVIRSGDTYAAYTREVAGLELPPPARTLWAVSGDPTRVDPSLRK